MGSMGRPKGITYILLKKERREIHSCNTCRFEPPRLNLSQRAVPFYMPVKLCILANKIEVQCASWQSKVLFEVNLTLILRIEQIRMTQN